MNPLFKESLSTHFWDKKLLAEWEIGVGQTGTDWVNIHFPYRYSDGRPANIKVIRYGFDLKRKKEGTFFLTAGRTLPLFGIQQLNKPENKNKPIALVESEKTVLTICRWLDCFVWMATGGTSGLTTSKGMDLKGRTVHIFYDADKAGRMGSTCAKIILERVGCTVSSHDLFPTRNDGHDLADEFIIQSKKISDFNNLTRESRTWFSLSNGNTL